MGRPMIECSVCFNWLHMSCVRLRKNNVPETYVCDSCKSTTANQSTPSSTKAAAPGEKKRRAYTKKRKSPSSKDHSSRAHSNSGSDQNTSDAPVAPSVTHLNTNNTRSPDASSTPIKQEYNSSKPIDTTPLPVAPHQPQPVPFLHGLTAPPRFTSAPPAVNNDSSIVTVGTTPISLQKPNTAPSHLCTMEYEKFIQGKFFNTPQPKPVRFQQNADSAAVSH